MCPIVVCCRSQALRLFAVRKDCNDAETKFGPCAWALQERGRWRLIIVEDGGRRSVFFPSHGEALKFKAGSERDCATGIAENRRRAG